MSDEFWDELKRRQAVVNGTLEAALSRATWGGPGAIHDAMAYSLFAPGKRLRPILVMFACEAAGGTEEQALPAACAVEMVHTYSLIHDDLPAMDDDDLRRGRPTVHVAFDEATAILAGDALQAQAFSLLAEETRAPHALRVAWLATLANATGAAGMCGGQALDMAGTGASLALEELERLHALKTGALIRAAVRMGALAGTNDGAVLQPLDDFAAALGLAFQIRDDLLDIEASSEQLGKTAGKDQAQAKSTYPSLLGADGARDALARQVARMDHILAGLGGDREPLRALARLAVERQH